MTDQEKLKQDLIEGLEMVIERVRVEQGPIHSELKFRNGSRAESTILDHGYVNYYPNGRWRIDIHIEASGEE